MDGNDAQGDLRKGPRFVNGQVDHEDLPIRDLLELLLDDRMRRKLRLRQMTNEEWFDTYDASELVFRNPSPVSLSDTRRSSPDLGGYLIASALVIDISM